MRNILFISLLLFLYSCQQKSTSSTNSSTIEKNLFYAVASDDEIKIYKEGNETALVTHNAHRDHRPYLHPVNAPNSNISLTQYSPDHHKHQTGLYWGFTRINGTGAHIDTLKKWFYRKDKPAAIQKQIGRDFFHNPGKGYWQKISAELIIEEGEEVKWQTVYHMMDEQSQPIMKETQTWTFAEKDNKYLLSLEWEGEALTDITINEFDYGGMFLRMPWHKDVEGEVINAARQRNEKAEGQRAMWVDAGMAIDGLTEWGHIAILDHPDNDGFPQTWRVDGQLGIGPVRARMGDWKINKGETRMIRHQLIAYSGKLNDIEMNEIWGDYVGDKGMYNTASLWGIAQEEALGAKFLTPDEAIAEMSIKEGYKVNTFAAEPMITQPMAFCWDDKGRMWIAENRDYESRGHGFSNSGDSRILILEDTDLDGTADKQSVFLENIPFPSAIAVGFGGLYLGAPPNLLFVPDKDHDDKADVDDIKVLLTGWGIRDRHETINSFHWGPDGWLYGLEGFATPSKIRKPIGEGKIYRAKEPFPEDLLEADGVDINGGVWRYHPIKDRFEVVAHGFSNPWGIDYDRNGELFISACVIPHLFHIIPGGIYHRQGGTHFNPYVYKDIQTIVDHRHRSAHGGARIYQSDAFPEDQQGRLFMANIHEHAVLSDVLQQKGSGFVASHGEDFILANNAQWIGFSMEVGPEGGLYVLDWHDADICGKEVLNKETGRVFRIMPEQSEASDWSGRFQDLNLLDDDSLVELQLSKSDWHARRARIILQSRAAQQGISSDAKKRLSDILDQDADYKLRALWTLYITNSLTGQQLENLLTHKDPYVRSWAIQFLCEDGTPSKEVMERFIKMSRSDKSPVTRRYLAAALQRIETESRWSLAEGLVQFEEDRDDPNIPFMLWFGIENLVPSDPGRALSLAVKSQIPIITNHIARRLVDADQLEILINTLARKSDNQIHLLEGILAGIEGRTDIKATENWMSVFEKLKSVESLSSTATLIIQHFGSSDAAKEMLALIRNKDSDLALQKNAIFTLATQQREELIAELPGLLHDKKTRIEAIRALAGFENETIGKSILDNYNKYDPLEKQAAIQTLSSRPIYGRLLASAIRDNSIPRRDIPAYIALQLRRVVGNGFVEIWGPIDQMTSNYKAQYTKYQRLLSESAIDAADPSAGRHVFTRVCGVCHKMYDQGGVLGPDLTGSNRANTAYLLNNIIEPSGELQDDYKMVVITTQDGRIYSGNIVAQNERQTTLRIVGQDNLILNNSDIQSKEITNKSMMPEGILNTLTDQEVLNLTAYMKTLEQVAYSKAL